MAMNGIYASFRRYLRGVSKSLHLGAPTTSSSEGILIKYQRENSLQRSGEGYYGVLGWRDRTSLQLGRDPASLCPDAKNFNFKRTLPPLAQVASR